MFSHTLQLAQKKWLAKRPKVCFVNLSTNPSRPQRKSAIRPPVGLDWNQQRCGSRLLWAEAVIAPVKVNGCKVHVPHLQPNTASAPLINDRFYAASQRSRVVCPDQKADFAKARDLRLGYLMT
ncbi:hypothetical protein NBRC116594_08690 [Shimia sp. NS0008-38b]